jgi:SAM-dependent methyltransferase
MDWQAKTIETYDASAPQWAEYFKGIGARVLDIELGLSLADKADGTARVVEIGCGSGRDAKELIERVGWYEGFDPSKEFLKLARSNVQAGSFVQADALSYTYPEQLDAVFAFASLLHVSKPDLSHVLTSVHSALRPGGILYISLKERAAYAEVVTHEVRGDRMFYYYNPLIIEELAGSSFATVHEAHQVIGNTDWFTLALQKV